MQRLFSTFANGWPGRGLLLQRALVASALFHAAIVHIGDITPLAPTVLRMIGACIGILLLAGLWTPVVGTLVAVLEVWIACLGMGDPLIPIFLATLGATLAMIGPGAWSVDARLFGRKRIDVPRH